MSKQFWKKRRFPSLQEVQERLAEIEREKSFWEQMKVVVATLEPPADPPEAEPSDSLFAGQ